MELPLTPLDFLARARRLFPDREASIEHHAASARTSSRTPTWPSAPPGSRTCCRTTSASARATGSAWLCGNTPRAARGLLRRAAGRRGAAAAQHPPGRPPSSAGQLDDSRATVLVRASRTRPRSTIRCARRRSATSTRRCSPRNRSRGSIRPRSTSTPSPSSSTRAGSTGTPKGALLTPPRPVPARHPLRAHAGHQRRRRRPAHDPALPRERLGHAALRHRARRRARDAAAVRRRPRCSASSRPSGSPACSSCRRWLTLLLDDPTLRTARPDERAAALGRRRADAAGAARRGRAPTSAASASAATG